MAERAVVGRIEFERLAQTGPSRPLAPGLAFCRVHRERAPEYRGRFGCCWVAELTAATARVTQLEASLVEAEHRAQRALAASKDWEHQARVTRGQLLSLQEDLGQVERELHRMRVLLKARAGETAHG